MIEDIKNEKLVVSQCINSDYCKGYNDAIDCILDKHNNEHLPDIKNEPDYKAIVEELKSGKYNHDEKFNINIIKLKHLIQYLEQKHGMSEEVG